MHTMRAPDDGRVDEAHRVFARALVHAAARSSVSDAVAEILEVARRRPDVVARAREHGATIAALVGDDRSSREADALLERALALCERQDGGRRARSRPTTAA